MAQHTGRRESTDGGESGWELDNLSRVRRDSRQGEEWTHRSIEQVVHDLGIRPIERALLWLSKTDLYALGNCTHHTRLTLSGLGLMVLFTTILAFVSGITALNLVMNPGSDVRVAYTVVAAAIYAFGIMLIDREIVGNPGNSSLLVRVVFAFAIATAVSYPIKMKLLEGPIRAEVESMVEERNAEKVQRIASLQEQGRAEKNAQLKDKDEQLAGIRRLIRELEAQINDERTRPELGARCDRRCETAKAQLVEVQSRESKILEERGRLGAEDGMTASAQSELGQLRSEIAKQKAESNDFLSYWQAQERVFKKDQSGARYLSGFLFVFFLALELVPVFLKYALGTSEYHQYLEARSRLNIQKINTVTNMLLQDIQNAESLEDVMALPSELTDLISYLMEDSTRPFLLERQFRAYFAAKNAEQRRGEAPGSDPDQGPGAT